MTVITPEEQALVANATDTSLVFNSSTSFPSGEPNIGDLVVVAIERNGSNGAVTPSGSAATHWTERTDARAIGTATVKGTVHYFYRIWDGTEDNDYTWTFASSARRGVFYRFSHDVDGGRWVPAEAMTPYLGTNTTSTSFQFPNATGPFADSVNAVVSTLVLSAGSGTTTPTNNQMQIVFGANVSQLSAYQVTSGTSALQPTWGWGAVTFRAKAAGALAAWRVDPPITETADDDLGLTDDVVTNLFDFDPASAWNFALDVKHGEDQVTAVYLGDVQVWNWLDPTPFSELFDTPGAYYRFVVPEGTEEIAFEGGGGRGGKGSSFGTTPGVGSSVGGAGSLMIGTLAVQPGDVIEGYSAAAGGNAYDTNQAQGGEPGGAASENNIFDHEDEALGGCGGGATTIWKNGVLMAVIAGGGGGGADGQGASGSGGDGGAGGGDEGEDGGNGDTNSTPPTKGFGGGGGTQTEGGAGGIGGSLSNGTGTGEPGGFLGGGSTYRRGAFGSGLEPHPCGGGGGGGYYGGGGGGNGSVQSLVQCGGGGGGGGSDYQDPTDVEATSLQGGNALDDGYLLFVFTAKRGT